MIEQVDVLIEDLISLKQVSFESKVFPFKRFNAYNLINYPLDLILLLSLSFDRIPNVS